MRRENIIRYGCAAVMIVGMVWLSEILGEKEIIFPEIAALVIGAWLAKEQPWEVSRGKMLVLMTVAAFFGIAMARFEGIPLLIKVYIAFMFTAISLTVTKCTMLPMISACILPILMGTTTVIYPVAVLVMTAIILAVQWIFEKLKIYKKRVHIPCVVNHREQARHWGMIFLPFALISALALSFNCVFLIAPPLIVTYTEFAEEESKARNKPFQIYFILITSALIGMLGRKLLQIQLNWSATATVCVILIALFVLFWYTK